MAEEGVLGHPAGERGLERVDVVDALADVAALVKHVLIEIGHRGRVRVDADVSREHAGEHRAIGAHDAHADARLQHAVALGHALEPGVKAGTVQRVRQRADEPPPGFHRQLCVGVEGEDVTDRRQERRLAVLHHEAGVGRAAQQAVELGELAALSFGAHPPVLAGVPLTRAMEEEKAIGPMPGVEVVDAATRRLDERRVLRTGRLIRVGEVRQQREMQMGIAIGKEADLEIVEEGDETRFGVDDCRDRHDRAIGGGNARPQVELRQLARADLRGDDEVDEADRQLAEGQEHDERRQPQIARGTAAALGVGDEAGDGEGRHPGDRPEIAEDGVTVEKTREALAQRRRIPDFALEPKAPARDEVVADVMRAIEIR